MRVLRSLAVGAVLAFLITISMPARPANAIFLWYGATYNGMTFHRTDGTPFMTMQEKCVYCVASATAAWIDYVWVAQQGDFGHRFSQDTLWQTDFQTNQQWSGWNTSLVNRCGGFFYNRRSINASQDDGVDPYGAAWRIFERTPPGYYYHQNVYSTGAFNGVSFATHGVAESLARFSEPAGVVIDNGGHYVLLFAIEADEDPRVNFWTPLRKVLIRDPFRPVATQQVEYRYDLNEWHNAFTPYGYNGQAFAPAPNCGPSGTNCRDEMRTGVYAGNLWWGRFVTIERSPETWDPDTIMIWDD